MEILHQGGQATNLRIGETYERLQAINQRILAEANTIKD